MKIIFQVVIFLFISNYLKSQNDMEKKWFNNKDFDTLEIVKYKGITNGNILSKVLITDDVVINLFIERIEQIPFGEEKICFGPNAEKITLVFKSEGEASKEINIYDKHFKTPSTGFNSKDNVIESNLYNDIDALLFPDYGKKILLVTNLELNFKNFPIKYLGREFIDNIEHTTVSIVNTKFTINDKVISITSGQTPPKPFEIKIKDEEIIIMTYETDDSFRLYPNYFQVVKIKKRKF